MLNYCLEFDMTHTPTKFGKPKKIPQEVNEISPPPPSFLLLRWSQAQEGHTSRVLSSSPKRLVNSLHIFVGTPK
ncbi:hypothetical protein Ocin01_03380 [Orchesella cincta]|uniref:Uncharacterized protein n=1 Tax=Orchesella cincta TaxID=48709 RepID=A0A1D2NDD6_ORCCI|nr:hypothetical protein Ocin01_03380 [Orchesella cincta]